MLLAGGRLLWLTEEAGQDRLAYHPFRLAAFGSKYIETDRSIAHWRIPDDHMAATLIPNAA